MSETTNVLRISTPDHGGGEFILARRRINGARRAEWEITIQGTTVLSWESLRFLRDDIDKELAATAAMEP